MIREEDKEDATVTQSEIIPLQQSTDGGNVRITNLAADPDDNDNMSPTHFAAA